MITDRAGALMYVGCTNDIYQRQAHHRSKSPWFSDSWMIHHKPYEDREYAERVEARAIRRYRPPHNKRGNPEWKGSPQSSEDISERTAAGMAAARAAGKKFGRRPLIWHNGHGSAGRIAALRDMDQAGELREQMDGEWVLIPKAEALMIELNKQKNRTKGDREIENAETVRRWVRNGWQGLETDDG